MKLAKTLIAVTILLLVILIFSILQTTFSSDITESVVPASDTESEMVEEVVYPHDEVVSVNIEISESNYNDMIENAIDEDVYLCDITYNGYTLTNVAIRTKGNSSLRDVYLDGDDRFSFNIDLNYYIDQDLFGIDKLILNNLFKDPTMMADYLTYEAFESLNAVSSRTTYTALYINDEYYGLYLSVESVSNEFLETNYEDSLGELYKPETGTGSDLAYISDDASDYTGLVNTNTDDYSNESILELIQAIETGENIDDIFNVDSFLKYLAISTYTVHLDSYQSGMFHNYYLYNDDGIYQWIPWDLNMTFNGFPGANMTDAVATQFLIDEPVVGSLSDYPLVETILDNEDYLEQYHIYLQELMDNYFDEDTFEQRVLEVYTMINDYVKTDSNSFYSYYEFKDSLFTSGDSTYSITQFVEERNSNIEQQLTGVIPSTNDGLGNVISGESGPGQAINDRPTGQGGLPGDSPQGDLPQSDLPQGDLPQGDLPQDNTIQDVITPTETLDTTEEPSSSYNSLIFTSLGIAGLVGVTLFLSKKKF